MDGSKGKLVSSILTREVDADERARGAREQGAGAYAEQGTCKATITRMDSWLEVSFWGH